MALYGCENWDNLNDTELLLIERAHRFCVKHMQSLNLRTRTDVAFSLLGIFPIEIDIDFRKLTLFGQFCRFNSNIWVKIVFLNRIPSYIAKCNHKQEGFVPDFVRLLENTSWLTPNILILKREHSQHPLYGNVCKRVNCIAVQFLLGTVEHWHTTFVDSEIFILSIRHTGYVIFWKREEIFYFPVFLSFKWYLIWLRCQWITNSVYTVMCMITIL